MIIFLHHLLIIMICISSVAQCRLESHTYTYIGTCFNILVVCIHIDTTKEGVALGM